MGCFLAVSASRRAGASYPIAFRYETPADLDSTRLACAAVRRDERTLHVLRKHLVSVTNKTYAITADGC
jgi:hypothetical protein